VPGLNKISEGICESFEAPDGDAGRDVVFALMMQTPQDAHGLARLLQ
jgi:hypothetical protein